ncbi:MAG TPA: TA system VapC family ribonuclease toxin [Candidatus Micrarchaeaceae archaeon]|nr:TA system VapC family ribonuclease toxin [Candidatus Micrarchaeaceae archaeon]
MSASVDANILIYASNQAEPVHQQAIQLVQRLAAGPDLLYLFWPTMLGYLRIVTDPAILPKPLSPRDAAANVEALVSRPHVRTPGEADGFWELFRSTSRDQARGNDVPDAHLVTLMRQHGVRRIYSRDSGFRRYPDVEVVDPFVAPPAGGRRSRGL